VIDRDRMEYRSSLSLGPSSTPLSLKILLLSTALLSLLSPWLIPYLALSLFGIEHWFLWQLITYPLIHPFPIGLFQLAIHLYLIWTFGASLLERIHTKAFFSLYFGSAIFCGGCALLGMYLTGTLAPLMGSGPVLFSLLICWSLLNPEAQLLLFFALPLKARHLIIGWIAIALLMDLSNSHWVMLFTDIGSILFGYLFTLLVCRVRSPFTFLQPFERGMLRLLEKLSSLGRKEYRPTKVYDIKSGSPILNDEQFMDAMLARISLYGEDSLTSEEKSRMHQISQKKSSRK
jgi:membrane associated rhomboid family serine protease